MYCIHRSKHEEKAEVLALGGQIDLVHVDDGPFLHIAYSANFFVCSFFIFTSNLVACVVVAHSQQRLLHPATQFLS